MMENIRFLFSGIWLLATGCLFASALVFIFTWGDYAPFFYWSAGVWMVSTIVVVISSLNG